MLKTLTDSKGQVWVLKSLYDTSIQLMQDRAAEAEKAAKDLIELIKGPDYLATFNYNIKDAAKAIKG